MTLTLNFQGQIWNLLHLSQKWSDCHETKSKHIDWTLGLKCDHRFWPWPWPWPWIFKVKCGICYISVKNGPIATKRKANISIDLKTSNVTIGFDLGHDLDLEFSRSNMELAISLPKMVRLPQNEKQTHRLNSWPQMWPSDLTLAVTLTLNFQGEIWIFTYLNQNWPDCHETKSKHIDLNSRPQIWPMYLTLAMTLIFEFWRSYVILTIWWPRSGVRIYQIVTGVTSDVGVPSTHLVKNVVAVAAYSRLASRSQAKFQTMKLSPLSTPCAAAPAQSTVSTCRSLRFLPRSCTDVNLTRTVPVAFPRHFSKQETKSVGGCLSRLSVGRRSGRFSTSHLT